MELLTSEDSIQLKSFFNTGMLKILIKQYLSSNQESKSTEKLELPSSLLAVGESLFSSSVWSECIKSVTLNFGKVTDNSQPDTNW